MGKSPLLVAAIAASTVLILTPTDIPIVGTNDDVRAISVAATTVLWFAVIVGKFSKPVYQHIFSLRAEIDRLREYTKTDELLRAAGHEDDPVRLPTPHGDIRPIPADVDGETVLVGVDESTHLAPVVWIRRALTDDGQAAK